jgi:hypothetical protein
VETQLGADNNDGTARIVNTLPDQVLAEAAGFSLQHIGKRLQRPLVRSGYGTSAPSIIKECIDSLLEHTLFVPDNDLGRL